MRRAVLVIILFSFALGLFSEEFVYNNERKKILLKDDKTWIIVEENQNNVNNFRKSKWGMTIDDIKGIEINPIKYESDSILVYSDTLLGFNTDVAYIFSKNKLIRSKYIFRNEHSNRTDFISDYLKIRKSLIEKYSDPEQDKQIWKNDLYKSDISEWGMAIAIGHLSYYSLWNDENTSVFLYLSGENYKIEFGIEYSSIQLKDLEKQEEIEESSNKL